MSTEVTDHPDRHRYEVTQNGVLVGLATYRLSPGAIEVDHTEVDPDHRGRGLAVVLVRAVLDDARSRGLAVLPHCSYVADVIDGHRADYLDLVPADRLAEFGLDT